MAFKLDKNGNISMIQGDSGVITIRGINPNKNFNVYFAIKDKNRQTIGNELIVNNNNNSYVMFHLSGEFTDNLVVKKNEMYAVYYYGIKICDEDSQREDTLIIGANDVSSLNTITVYPKKVEGM